MVKKKRSCLRMLVFGLFIASPLISFAADTTANLSKGQTIYIPAYSDIYIGSREQPFFLTVTLSIRNSYPKHPIHITRVDYYETQGKLIKKHVDKPIKLQPLESLRYVIPQKDETGGSGANFIVKWMSEKPVNPPIVESIMIGAQAQQGVSFSSRGQESFSSE